MTDATLPESLPGVEATGLSSPAVLAAPGDDKPKVSARYIWLLILAQFGAFIAFVTPVAITLAIRVKDLAPDNEEFLGYVLGAGSIGIVIFGPLFGVLSDRTRSRFGRRRPWMLGGAIVGMIALCVMGTAPSVFVLGIGWVLAQLGWGTATANFANSQADRLPESQRGKVGGLIGFVNMAAPVFGAIIGGSLAGMPVAMFLVPGLIGFALSMLFIVFIREDDNRSVAVGEPLTTKLVLSKYIYNPRTYPDFSWNFLGRFLFYIGLTLNTAFTAYFIASKLGLAVSEVGGIVAISGLLGVVAVMGGAIGGGFLSDKIRRRKAFVLGSGIIFAIGALVMAFAPGLETILVGMFLANLGLGVFSAVDQALVLDVLPERDTDAGRFMAINNYSHTVAQAVGPLIAPLILTLGVVAGAEKNYTLLYIVAAAFTVAGGFIVLRVKSVR